MTEYLKNDKGRDFSGGPVVKNLSSNAGDMGSILGGRTNDYVCCLREWTDSPTGRIRLS